MAAASVCGAKVRTNGDVEVAEGTDGEGLGDGSSGCSTAVTFAGGNRTEDDRLSCKRTAPKLRFRFSPASS